MPGPRSAAQRNHPLCGVDTTIRYLPRSSLAITFRAVAFRSSVPSSSNDALSPEAAPAAIKRASRSPANTTGIS